MLDQEDEGVRVGVWTVLGVVALLLFGLIGGLAIRAQKVSTATSTPVAGVMPAVTPAPDAATAAPATATAAGADSGADAVRDVPLSGEIIARIYFASTSADLGPDDAAALRSATDALAAAPSRHLMIAGFHDTTGDPSLNAELAKKRARAVRDALMANGVDAAAIILRKPESTAGGGTDAQARRVEVRIVE